MLKNQILRRSSMLMGNILENTNKYHYIILLSLNLS